MSGVNNTGAIFNYTQASQKKNNKSTDKDQFLQIIATQMKYQNPLEPMKDTEFISQMAQFSTLEQLINLNQQSQFNHAVSFIGYHAYGYADGEFFDGVVDTAILDEGVTKVLIGDKLYNVSDIFMISFPTPKETPGEENPGEGNDGEGIKDEEGLGDGE